MSGAQLEQVKAELRLNQEELNELKASPSVDERAMEFAKSLKASSAVDPIMCPADNEWYELYQLC
jgi:hypothetical protein